MRRIGRWAYVMIAVGVAGVAWSYPNPTWLRDVSVLLLNVGLISLLPALFAWLERPLPLLGNSLRLVGKYSLWIYLLHPLVTAQLKDNPGASFSNWMGGIGLTLVLVLVCGQFGRLFEARIEPKLRASQPTPEAQ
jgi:peptidoglycan/LPS O-acetylase OafA/YrhL